MNFIAHLFLSGYDEDLMVGNFIADAVKGKQDLQNYPFRIQQGIILHRKIDSFTDNHLIFRESKAVLVPKYNHFSGILVDIFYDHFLTRNWDLYSSEPLHTFSIRCIDVIERKWENIPDKMRMFFSYTKRYDRINGYSKFETIKSVLNGMNRRTHLVSGMDKASKELEMHFDALEKHFKLFFPELQAYVTNEINLLNQQ